MPVSRPAARAARAAATVAVVAAAALPAPAPATPAAPASSLSSHHYLDELGRPTPYTQAKVNEFADQPYVPQDVANALRSAVSFFGGTGDLGGPPLPADAPPFTQFYWPTVSSNCIGKGLHSTASALVVPGPATSPAPGAGPGQATFVFTALGTPAAARDQGELKVYWINLNTFRTGVTPLGNNGINPSGPATLSGTASTGPGRVLAVVDGQVRTTANVCAFAPTAASFSVR